MRRAAVVLGVTLIASVAAADPHSILWRNASLDEEVRYFAACREGSSDCGNAEVRCAPGAVCETELSLQPGTYPAVLFGSPDGQRWGGPSESRVITVQAVVVPEPDPEADACRTLECRADFDGDGVVGLGDFTVLWRLWGASCE